MGFEKYLIKSKEELDKKLDMFKEHKYSNFSEKTYPLEYPCVLLFEEYVPLANSNYTTNSITVKYIDYYFVYKSDFGE